MVRAKTEGITMRSVCSDIQGAKALLGPSRDGKNGSTQTKKNQEAAEEQARFQRDPTKQHEAGADPGAAVLR